MSQVFPHDSFAGGLNLFKRRENRFLLYKGERPPYPIIIDSPTFSNVVSNMNTADIGIILFFGLLGI